MFPGRSIAATNRRCKERFRSNQFASATLFARTALTPTRRGASEMSIFGRIMGKIFGTDAQAATPAGSAAAAPKPAGTAGTPGATTPAASAPSASGTPGAATATAGAAADKQVDVNAVLTEMASRETQKLDWKHSIVDLMKLLDLDSSLTARKELAKELNYTGDTDDSATMNIWLHKQVMQKLAENGGKVPDDLRN
jgi:hypothetical protein